MESEVCMNELCGASLTIAAAAAGGGDGGGGDIKKGWNLRSGGIANLCDRCSTAYEQQGFCKLFHRDDTGWRECTSCAKRLHCGCIASSAFLELLDNGGVTCVSCRNGLGHKPMQRKREEKSKETGISVEHTVGEIQLSSINNYANIGNLNETMLTQMNDEGADNFEKSLLPSASKSQMKHEENVHPSGENGHKKVFGSLVQTNLAIGLGACTVKPVFYPGKAVEEKNSKSTLSYFQQEAWSRHTLPKSILPREFINANAGVSTPIRVARPPVEGRIKSQLLPRYWPRITDQELQQISGDSNATIVPLFEKVLSASDAGRIGRLVLPKACAEAYFPPISQPEGLPLRIQDVKGNEWLFQFRFWPNNNSRMYVLEGVTPCIQSMQLLAGDTVMFSRMEPEGKLLMGFRKAPTSTSVQLLKGSMYPNLNEFSRNVNLPNRDIWPTIEQLGSKLIAGSFPPSVLIPEKKRSRNIGSKSKRLLIESQDSLELKHTWEESQEMLFPAPLLTASIITIDDNVFEEYEGPPIFGKGSIFSVCSSRDQEQWAQCDNCSKWRKLPADFLLPPKWTCQDNLWDRNRAACVAPDELNPRELENLLRLAQGFQKRRNFLSHKPEQEQGHNIIVDAETASVAIWDNEAEPSFAMTTKHPRHHPGCSCIVCIQPPSGKGKHKPTCTCNVCMTVKRRFTTLMLRKKKRQSEHEASIVLKNFKEEADVESMQVNESRTLEHGNSSKGHLDLNITPYYGKDNHGQTSRSMMSLIQVANLPLEIYLRQNGLTNLISEQQASSSSHVLPQETGETEGGDEADDDCPAPVVQEDKVGKNNKHDNIQDSCL